MSFISENESLISYAALTEEEINTSSTKEFKNTRYAKSRGRIHVVRRGETLSHLSHLYGVSVRSIMKANGLRSSRIKIGQRLVIGGYKHTKNHP